MAYTTLEKVKALRGIEVGDTSFNDLIAMAILYADAKIDTKLAENGEDVPLDSPPQMIQDISLFYAVGYITRKAMPQDQTPNYELTADTMLESYVQAKCRGTFFSLQPRKEEVVDD